MSILLIFPPNPKTNIKNISQQTHPALGICYLSSFLKSKGLSVHAADMKFTDENKIFDMISEHGVQIVGFSANTFSFDFCHTLARSIKSKFPYIKIVFGGMTAELFTDLLKDKVIDVIVIGRGEEAMHELAGCFLYDSKKLSDIPGIAYLKKDVVTVNEPRKNEISLDDLPFPDRECINLGLYQQNKMVKNQCYIATSRGCPHKCLFCVCSQVSMPYRARSVENVIKEIREVRSKYPVFERFHFVDDTLNINKTRFESLCLALKEEKISWSCNIKPDETLTEDLLVLMKESGVSIIEIGIESGSQAILDKLNKQTDINHIRNILKKTTELEIPVLATFIIPNFCDTVETLEETMTFIDECAAKYIFMPWVSVLYIHPKFKLAAYEAEYGVVPDPNHSVFTTREISRGRVIAALHSSNTIFQNAAARNFKYFSQPLNMDISNIANS